MSTLRIIAGKAKGMRIQTVPGESTRPITDRAKESLFNIISTDLIRFFLVGLLRWHRQRKH